MINESRPLQEPGGRDEYKKWLVQMAPEIKNMFPRQLIYAGVDNPSFVDDEVVGIDINTTHLYQFSSQVLGISDYLKTSKLPVVAQEWGVPSRVFGINYHSNIDYGWSIFAKRIFELSSEVDPEKKTVRLHLPRLGIWLIDEHTDGFNYEPEKMSATTRMLKKYNSIVAGAEVE